MAPALTMPLPQHSRQQQLVCIWQHQLEQPEARLHASSLPPLPFQCVASPATTPGISRYVTRGTCSSVKMPLGHNSWHKTCFKHNTTQQYISSRQVKCCIAIGLVDQDHKVLHVVISRLVALHLHHWYLLCCGPYPFSSFSHRSPLEAPVVHRMPSYQQPPFSAYKHATKYH